MRPTQLRVCNKVIRVKPNKSLELSLLIATIKKKALTLDRLWSSCYLFHSVVSDYSAILPSILLPLAYLHDWCHEGLIDPRS